MARAMIFYVGLYKPWHAKHFPRAFLSANRLQTRTRPLGCPDWIMDSGAFTELSTHGRYRQGVEDYARLANRLGELDKGLRAIVAQDYMCEAFILDKTGLSIADHQRLTIERYDQLLALARPYVLPVLQGYRVEDYLKHLELYGSRLVAGAYVGVGSLCKRNGRPGQIEAILTAIKARRPDLQLHGFGLKTTALKSDLIRRCLCSADSMAWSFAARWERGRKGLERHHYRLAQEFADKIEAMPVQGWFPWDKFLES